MSTMDIVDKQAELLEKMEAEGLFLQDNTIDTLTSFPAVIFDIEDEALKNRLQTVEDDKFYYRLYAFEKLSNHDNSYSKTRKFVSQLIKSKLKLIKCNSESRLSYGELIINNQKCCGANILIKIEV